MLIELNIVPLGRGLHLSQDLAEVLKVIDDSGLPYCLTPSGTCIEGEWGEVMSLVQRCHAQARTISQHVLTTIRIEDDAGTRHKLAENIAGVERAAGRTLRRAEPTATAPSR
ncbi:MAG: MTH1187 family thiamine-binding protein [Acidobacteria bacterium]|nr:MTH1187 family thiamine-binding protein [Acidobacteriota bacterium]